MFSTLSRGVNRLVVEKFLFRWGAIAAGKPTELSARGHDPVARDDDRDWIGAAGLPTALAVRPAAAGPQSWMVT